MWIGEGRGDGTSDLYEMGEVSAQAEIRPVDEDDM